MKIQLGSKADATHHAQRVITKRHLGIQRCGNDAILQVGNSIKRIYQFAESILIQADSHGIDGKVATILVILQRTILHHRLTRVVAIALLTCTNELHFYFLSILAPPYPRTPVPPYNDLRRAEVLEYAKMCSLAHSILQGFRHTNAHTYGAFPLASWRGNLGLRLTYHNYIDVVRGAFQKDVTHISTNHITFYSHLVSYLANLMEDILI